MELMATREGASVFIRGVVPGRLTRFQWIVPYLYTHKQNSWDPMVKKKVKRGTWEEALRTVNIIKVYFIRE